MLWVIKNWQEFDKSDFYVIMPIISKIFDTYFEIKRRILFNGLEKNSAFIWARKTDKSSEVKLPTTFDYYDTIKNCRINKIYIQTDDNSVIREFRTINDKRISFLHRLPTIDVVSGTEGTFRAKGFHTDIHIISDDSFLGMYKMTKIEYLKCFVSLVHFAANSKYVVCYPGNLTTVIPMIRKSFVNCFLFLDDTRIIK